MGQVFGLDGKVAVVTGAAHGLGRSIATLLAEAGAAIVIADRDADAAEATAAEMRDGGLGARAIETDVTQEAAVIGLFAEVQAEFDRCDILVNNAGAYPKFPFIETTLAQWDTVHAINLRGTFLCMREALKLMQPQRFGRIVNISSVASIHPAVYGNGAYAAAKGGVNMLTKSAALDFVGDGITVNAVLPGPVKTGGDARQFAPVKAPPVRGPAADPARWITGRMGEPEEVAAAVLYLVGPAGGYVTGQTLVIDGGFVIS